MSFPHNHKYWGRFYHLFKGDDVRCDGYDVQ